MKRFKKRTWILFAVLFSIGVGLVFFLTSQSNGIWPLRNIIQHAVLINYWKIAGEPQSGPPGSVRGNVRDENGRPVIGATVLFSKWDGTTYTAITDYYGNYLVEWLPQGKYRPIAGAPKYVDSVFGKQVGVKKETRNIDFVLHSISSLSPLTPGKNFRLSDPITVECKKPVAAKASRQEIFFDNDGRPNQKMFLYLPSMQSPKEQLPVAFLIYPGPPEDWECAGIPIAAEGYAVIAGGPAYTFDFESAVDELRRLLNFVREGYFPMADPKRIGLLGGSYSALHMGRLLSYDTNFRVAIFLNTPSDIFMMRKLLEEKKYMPPFGLDQAMYALGFPDRAPMMFWRYSVIFHLSPDFPPIGVIHSYNDEIVPYYQSEMLVTELKKMKIPIELYYFTGASHYPLSDEGGGPDILNFIREIFAEYMK